MILHVCRQVLRDSHESEDAFEATFLNLAVKAGSIRGRDSLSSWLYNVAYHVAAPPRSSSARRRSHELRAAQTRSRTILQDFSDDVGSVIHEELERLPDRYRAVIVWCCLEGLTQFQAAQRLGWPLGTVQSRGKGLLQLGADEIEALRQHLDPGGGTLFADAACGSAAFDASFRQLVAKLLPGHPLVPIPNDDPLLSTKVGFNLKDCEYTPAARGGRGCPQLEGVELNGHWAVIYSKLDISCALDGQADRNCNGYTPTSAARIAANVVIDSTLP